MKVMVLGCGPAGLIAANAAALEGADVKVLSNPRKSLMNGAQYLHKPITGINCGKAFNVDYQMIGDPLEYRFKVYGRQWDGTVSPEDLQASHLGWDIRDAYDLLWSIFGRSIVRWEATPSGLGRMIDRYRPDLIISTIPAPTLCHQGHQFKASKIWSTNRSMIPIVDNTVICNGDPGTRWYRISSIQGHYNTEWPDGIKPPVNPMWEVMKPLSNNCACFPEVIRAGRYGKWTKGVLSHEVQDEVIAKCRTFQEGLW